MTFLERAKRDQSINNLMLLPLQPFSHLSMVLATSDVAVATIEPEAGMFSVPSKVESYFCAGRPILLAAPHDNLAAETVLKSEAGLVVSPTDKWGFLNAASRLLEDDRLRITSGRKAYEFALAHYEIKRVAERFEKVFRHAIDTKSQCEGNVMLVKNGRTALVCGAGGSIGGHLVKRLKREGFWVRGVDLKFRHSRKQRPTILLSETFAINTSVARLSIESSMRFTS